MMMMMMMMIKMMMIIIIIIIIVIIIIIKLKEKFGSPTRKIFDRFTTKDSCTWNITRNTESTVV
jgi:biopolymer transport protein ExbB/TolQ